MVSFASAPLLIVHALSCWSSHIPSPIGSMYAIYGNIYHQYTPNVSIYIPYMDPMGHTSIVVVFYLHFWLNQVTSPVFFDTKNLGWSKNHGWYQNKFHLKFPPGGVTASRSQSFHDHQTAPPGGPGGPKGTSVLHLGALAFVLVSRRVIDLYPSGCVTACNFM